MTRMPSVYTKRHKVYRDSSKDDPKWTNRVWQKAYFTARKTNDHQTAMAVADKAYAEQKQ